MFSTTNMGLAAYLITARKLRYIKTIGHHPNPAEFIFDDPSNLGPELELAYINGETMVIAPDFLARVKSLRRSIDIAEKQRVAEGRAAGNRTSGEGVRNG
jgi:hypothetical protein